MHFKFTADIELEADNVDDAFTKLSNHFLSLSHGIDQGGLERTGSMEIHLTGDGERISETICIIPPARTFAEQSVRDLVMAARAVTSAITVTDVSKAMNDLARQLEPFRDLKPEGPPN